MLEIREHFNIPKIHAMVHYVAAVKSRGTLDGYNTESPERLHINYVLKRRTDVDVECTEDGRDGRIGATKYAGGNGTRKEAEKRNI